MRPCDCNQVHKPRRLVLTGGPGAGKTAVLELIRQTLCTHVKVLPEAAGVIFGGGFPRGDDLALLQAAQRAIFYVQRELEAAAMVGNPAIILCDRGTVDGAAYWRGPPDLWTSVGTSLEEQLSRYDVVIHLRTPAVELGYNRQNSLRIESAADARRIDQRIAEVWSGHPRYFVVESAADFITKASRVIELVRNEVPECCRPHVSAQLTGRAAESGARDPSLP